MKSVIAEGVTVGKAIEEALKRADMPQEFFIKLLEEAQSGFLGFGSKKAKIALFFKKEVHYRSEVKVLDQNSYKGLFQNQNLQRQIDPLMKTANNQKPIQKQQPKQVEQKQHNVPVAKQRVVQDKTNHVDLAVNKPKIDNIEKKIITKSVIPQIRPLKTDKSQSVIVQEKNELVALDQKQNENINNQLTPEQRLLRNRRRSRYYGPRKRPKHTNDSNNKI